MPRHKRDGKKPVYRDLGARLKEARTNAGLSQGDVANLANVSVRQIALMEAGENTTLEYLDRVATALNLKRLSLGRGLALETTPDLSHAREIATGLEEQFKELLGVLGARETKESNLIPFPDRRTPITFDDEQAVEKLRAAGTSPSKGSELEYRPTYRAEDPRHYVSRQGYVAAGAGAFEDAISPDEEKLRQIPEHYWSLGAREALVVRGNSMFGRGIVNRDLLFIRPLSPSEKPKNGDIIVVTHNGDLLVKAYEKRGGKVRLVSANRKYKPREVKSGDSIYFHGVVVGRSGYGLPSDEAGG